MASSKRSTSASADPSREHAFASFGFSSSPSERLDRPLDQCREREERALEIECGTEPCVGGGIVRIVRQRTLEERNGPVQRFAPGHAEVLRRRAHAS